jgi:hypothetical protein
MPKQPFGNSLRVTKCPGIRIQQASASMKYPLRKIHRIFTARLLLLSMGRNDNGYLKIMVNYPKITLGGCGNWAKLHRV